MASDDNSEAGSSKAPKATKLIRKGKSPNADPRAESSSATQDSVTNGIKEMTIHGAKIVKGAFKGYKPATSEDTEEPSAAERPHYLGDGSSDLPPAEERSNDSDEGPSDLPPVEERSNDSDEGPSSHSNHYDEGYGKLENDYGERPNLDSIKDERKREILRIFSWPELAYYELLEIADEVLAIQKNKEKSDEIKEAEIEGLLKPAFNRKAILTHPDKNNDKDAKDAYRRIHGAYKILSKARERHAYDTQRKTLKELGQLDQQHTGETFAKGAHDHDVGEEEEEEEEEENMSDEKAHIIAEMGPCVTKLLGSPDDAEFYENLVLLNTKMRNLNKEEGNFIDSHVLPISHIRNMGQKNERLREVLWSMPEIPKNKSKASEEAELAKQKVERDIKKLEHALKSKWDDLGFPNWTFPKERTASSFKGEDKRRPTNKQAKEPTSSSSKDKGKGRPANKQAKESTASSSKDKGKSVKFSTSEANQSGTSEELPPRNKSTLEAKKHIKRDDPMDLDLDWEPGETTRGEKILAYRPIRGWAEEKLTGRMVETESVRDYVIELEGEDNPIAIVSEVRVGRKAASAYKALPEEKKNNIANIALQYDRYDGASILEVKGLASKDSANGSGNLPWYVVWIDYDGEDRIINRSALKKACGVTGDDLIREFCDKIDIDCPFDSRYNLLQMRLENTRLKDRLRPLRRENGYREGVSLRTGRRISNFSDSSDSESDFFVSDDDFANDSSISRRGRIYRTNPPLNRRKQLEERGDGASGRKRRHGGQLSLTGRQHGQHREIEQNTGGNDVVTRKEMQKMMEIMMTQMARLSTG